MAGRSAGAKPRPEMWEYRVVTVPRAVSKAEYRRTLTEAAERGEWELRRVLVFRDGTRKVTLRRRAVSVQIQPATHPLGA